MTFSRDTAPCSVLEVDRHLDLMMEAVRTLKTYVKSCRTTRRNIPEDCHLQTLHRENLKSYKTNLICVNKDCLSLLLLASTEIIVAFVFL
jgi:hypothetical protein